MSWHKAPDRDRDRDPETGIAEHWRSRRADGQILDAILETGGRLSWTVRRSRAYRADWVTCAPGWTIEDAKRAADTCADLSPRWWQVKVSNG